MTVQDLIEKLAAYPPNTPVAIGDMLPGHCDEPTRVERVIVGNNGRVRRADDGEPTSFAWIGWLEEDVL
jgi:hypothetical protein